ncbi:hypothetical protein P5G50_03830 [Leifsonia sp. F6_8S_P_1B]|uniref:Signal transduction histidine kinase n=1 Tax=Leifsonia williamsii TaxID=3035919 RepID=A0ABT8K7Z1_9MICO|nr:hypothetical protein [Leifsonia williamsii]MDN4613575.1 hypothetical protein [Leifsonia williamsii]
MTGSVATRTSRVIARITGSSAITVWTWIVSLPFALTVMSGVQYIHGSPAEVLAVPLVQHLAIGVLLLAGRGLLALTPSRLRAVTVLAVYVAIGVLRPLLFLACGEVLGVRVDAGDLAGRIGINIVAVLAAFGLTALSVDLVREHLGVYRRLRAAQRASSRDAAEAEEKLLRLRRSAVDGVLEEIEHAAAIARQPIRPREAAQLLRGLANDVVRPASHRLYGEDESAEREDGAEPTVRRRDWFREVAEGIQAAPPVLVSALFALIVLPFGAMDYGPLPTLCAVAVAGTVAVAGNAAVARAVEHVRPAMRPVTMLVGYILVGGLLALTTGLIIDALGSFPAIVWFEVLTYPVMALSVALMTSLSARLRVDQSRLEQAVQASVREAARIRADYDHQRTALARLLHSGVQAELIAAALALGADGRDDASGELRAVVDRIRCELLTPAEEPPAADRLRALLDSWGSAIPLTFTIADGVIDRLEVPARCDAVVDAISEGLANAVRHGDGTPVTLDVRSADDAGVAVVVTSGGALAASDPGIGLLQLAERGTVELREVAGRVSLAVAIP